MSGWVHTVSTIARGVAKVTTDPRNDIIFETSLVPMDGHGQVGWPQNGKWGIVDLFNVFGSRGLLQRPELEVENACMRRASLPGETRWHWFVITLRETCPFHYFEQQYLTTVASNHILQR